MASPPRRLVLSHAATSQRWRHLPHRICRTSSPLAICLRHQRLALTPGRAARPSGPCRRACWSHRCDVDDRGSSPLAKSPAQGNIAGGPCLFDEGGRFSTRIACRSWAFARRARSRARICGTAQGACFVHTLEGRLAAFETLHCSSLNASVAKDQGQPENTAPQTRQVREPC